MSCSDWSKTTTHTTVVLQLFKNYVLNLPWIQNFQAQSKTQHIQIHYKHLLVSCRYNST